MCKCIAKYVHFDNALRPMLRGRAKGRVKPVLGFIKAGINKEKLSLLFFPQYFFVFSFFSLDLCFCLNVIMVCVFFIFYYAWQDEAVERCSLPEVPKEHCGQRIMVKCLSLKWGTWHVKFRTSLLLLLTKSY